jgi:hypothetical protein
MISSGQGGLIEGSMEIYLKGNPPGCSSSSTTFNTNAKDLKPYITNILLTKQFVILYSACNPTTRAVVGWLKWLYGEIIKCFILILFSCSKLICHSFSGRQNTHLFCDNHMEDILTFNINGWVFIFFIYYYF